MLFYLVGEVTEVEVDEDGLGSFIDLYASGRKSKFANNKKSKVPHKNAKLSKSPNVSR